MIWGCIIVHGVSELTILQRNVNYQQYIQVLNVNLLISVSNMFGDQLHAFVFLEDSAPVHRAQSVGTWLEDLDVNRVQYIARSPDINLIKNLWDDINMYILRDCPTIKTNSDTLYSIIMGEHHPKHIRRLYDSNTSTS